MPALPQLIVPKLWLNHGIPLPDALLLRLISTFLRLR